MQLTSVIAILFDGCECRPCADWRRCFESDILSWGSGFFESDVLSLGYGIGVLLNLSCLWVVEYSLSKGLEKMNLRLNQTVSDIDIESESRILSDRPSRH